MLKTQKDHIFKLQTLVDELMKPQPDELQIKKLMKNLNMNYESDPILRITYVMESMNKLVKSEKEKKVDYDL